MTAAYPEPAPDDEEVPGLAGERTDLAWNRSSLAVVVLAIAVARVVWTRVPEPTARVVVLGALAVAAATFVAAQLWAHGAARRTLEGRPVADPAAMLRVTVANVLLCIVALAVAVAA